MSAAREDSSFRGGRALSFLMPLSPRDWELERRYRGQQDPHRPPTREPGDKYVLLGLVLGLIVGGAVGAIGGGIGFGLSGAGIGLAVGLVGGGILGAIAGDAVKKWVRKRADRQTGGADETEPHQGDEGPFKPFS